MSPSTVLVSSSSPLFELSPPLRLANLPPWVLFSASQSHGGIPFSARFWLEIPFCPLYFTVESNLSSFRYIMHIIPWRTSFLQHTARLSSFKAPLFCGVRGISFSFSFKCLRYPHSFQCREPVEQFSPSLFFPVRAPALISLYRNGLFFLWS